MSDRLKQVPDEQFVAMLQKARQDVDALKAAQTSGSDSNVVYLETSSGTWDFFIDAVAPGGSAVGKVAYKFLHQKYGYGLVAARIYLDVVDAAHEVKVGDKGARDFSSGPFPPLKGSEKAVSWNIGVVYNDDTVAHRYYYKLYYLVTDILTT